VEHGHAVPTRISVDANPVRRARERRALGSVPVTWFENVMGVLRSMGLPNVGIPQN
jgi:hypothetical protein